MEKPNQDTNSFLDFGITLANGAIVLILLWMALLLRDLIHFFL